MVAKLAVWGSSRQEAIDRLSRALYEYAVSGITTTLSFFREVVSDEEFVAGKLDTGFIPRFNERRSQQLSNSTIEIDLALISAALHYTRVQRRNALRTAPISTSQWKMAGRKAILDGRDARNRHREKLNKR